MVLQVIFLPALNIHSTIYLKRKELIVSEENQSIKIMKRRDGIRK